MIQMHAFLRTRFVLSVPLLFAFAHITVRAGNPSECDKEAGDAAVRLVATEKHRFKIDGFFRQLAFSRDGTTLAATREKSAAIAWEMSNGKEKDLPKTTGIVLLEISTGRKTPFVPAYKNSLAHFIGFLPNGKSHLVCHSGTVEVRNSQNGDLERQFSVHRSGIGITQFALSPDGKELAVAMGAGDYAIKVFDVNSGKEDRSFKGHQKRIADLAFSPDGTTVASASSDERIVCIWKAKTGDCLHKVAFDERPICLAFDPQSNWLAVGLVAKSSEISIRDTKTGKEVLHLTPERNGSKSLSFNHDGKLFASTGGQFVQVWELSERAKKD